MQFLLSKALLLLQIKGKREVQDKLYNYYNHYYLVFTLIVIGKIPIEVFLFCSLT